jgi:hypothetical protein
MTLLALGDKDDAEIESDIPAKQRISKQKDYVSSLSSRFWTNRWESADLLEIRLDTTVLACHVLARFLVHDMMLPPKTVPGWEIHDIVLLLHTLSSLGILAILWTMVGLGIGLWQKSESHSGGTNINWTWMQLFGTTALVGPCWLIIERVLGWSVESTFGWQSVTLGSMGLFTTMALSRVIAQFVW